MLRKSSRKQQIISTGLSDRVEIERAILDHYENTIPGRRSDFVRDCLVAGFQAIYGNQPTPRLFPEDLPERVSRARNIPRVEQDRVQEDKLTQGKSMNLSSLMGHQE